MIIDAIGCTVDGCAAGSQTIDDAQVSLSSNAKDTAATADSRHFMRQEGKVLMIYIEYVLARSVVVCHLP